MTAGKQLATVLQLEARLLELPLANRYSGLVDRGETVGYNPQLEARLLKLPLANRYSGFGSLKRGYHAF